MRILLGLFASIFLIASSYSQPISKAGFQISIDGYQGTTLRHRPTMVFALPRPARMLSMELSRQTEGTRPWHHLYGYPRIGYTISVLAYGNREVLGRAYSLHPFLDIFLVKKTKLDIVLENLLWTGLARQKFERIENEGNNAIGSQINNHASLNLITEFRVQPKLWIGAGGTLSHNSNGKLQVPNLGLNTTKIRNCASYQLTPATAPIVAKQKYIRPAFPGSIPTTFERRTGNQRIQS